MAYEQQGLIIDHGFCVMNNAFFPTGRNDFLEKRKADVMSFLEERLNEPAKKQSLCTEISDIFRRHSLVISPGPSFLPIETTYAGKELSVFDKDYFMEEPSIGSQHPGLSQFDRGFGRSSFSSVSLYYMRSSVLPELTTPIEIIPGCSHNSKNTNIVTCVNIDPFFGVTTSASVKIAKWAVDLTKELNRMAFREYRQTIYEFLKQEDGLIQKEVSGIKTYSETGVVVEAPGMSAEDIRVFEEMSREM